MEEIYQFLSRSGFDPWLDKHKLVGGSVWKAELEESVRGSDFFIACLSSKAIDKRGVFQREVRLALEVWTEKLMSDIYLIPVRLDDCTVPMPLAQFQWVDYFTETGEKNLLRSLQTGLERLGLARPVTLRASPIANLLPEQVVERTLEQDYFDTEHNWAGKGLWHEFNVKSEDRVDIIEDRITGLMWQRAGSEELVYHLDGALGYVDELNHANFGGYRDWRLPTVDEAMGLLIPQKIEGLFISKLFDRTQSHIQTSDTNGATEIGIHPANRVGPDIWLPPRLRSLSTPLSEFSFHRTPLAWSINFDSATATIGPSRLNYVRAVRSS